MILASIDYPIIKFLGQILALLRSDYINLQPGGSWPLTLPVQAKLGRQSDNFGQYHRLIGKDRQVCNTSNLLGS
jgi:hypothetical protein